MPTIAATASRNAIFQRVAQLRPDTERLWGKMDVYQMCAHLGDQLRVVLGIIPVQPAGNVLTRTLVKSLVLWGMPAPKGKVKTFPEVDQAAGRGSKPGTLEEEKLKLKQLVDEFLALPEGTVFQPHSVFGPLTRAEWGRLIYIHIDHHLRQFGL